MRTKKVSRYWCDFCSKAGLQAAAMRKHEKHCTMNPARACRVCNLIINGLSTEELEAMKPLAEMVAMMPDPAPYQALSFGDELEREHSALIAALVAVLPALRLAAGGCPACMLAAIRQSKNYVAMVDGFNFSGEMKDIFDAANSERAEQDYY